MRITNTSKGTVLATHARLASSFWARFKGLLGTQTLPQGSGLLLERTKQVHMFFMRYPIDVAFLGTDNTVVGCVHRLRPWQVSPVFRGATRALELPAGTLAASATEPGDALTVSGSGDGN